MVKARVFFYFILKNSHLKSNILPTLFSSKYSCYNKIYTSIFKKKNISKNQIYSSLSSSGNCSFLSSSGLASAAYPVVNAMSCLLGGVHVEDLHAGIPDAYN